MLKQFRNRCIRWATPQNYVKHCIKSDLALFEQKYSEAATKKMEADAGKMQALAGRAERFNNAALKAVGAAEQIRLKEAMFSLSARQSVRAVDAAIAQAKATGHESPEAQKLIQEIVNSCGTPSPSALPLQPGQTYYAPVPSSPSDSAHHSPLIPDLSLL